MKKQCNVPLQFTHRPEGALRRAAASAGVQTVTLRRWSSEEHQCQRLRCDAAAGDKACCCCSSSALRELCAGPQLQPGHQPGPQEGRRPGESVRLLPGAAPAAQPGQTHVSVPVLIEENRQTETPET